MTYLKPNAIVALHYLSKAESLSYLQLENRLAISRSENLELTADLYKLGLVDFLVEGLAITTSGKWALKIGWVE